MNIYKRALEIQDACNPVAVAGTLHDTMLILSRTGLGTDLIRKDPAVLILLDKLCSLSEIQNYHVNMLPAYAACEERSHASNV